MTRQIARETIYRCLTPTPEDCPRIYEASIIGKELHCMDPGRMELEGSSKEASA
jgi:hypothetical protein